MTFYVHPKLVWTKAGILDVPVEVIVNAANKDLKPGGGVCGVIHGAAGPILAIRCAEIRKKRRKPIPTGSVAVTAACGKLGVKATCVFHAVGPIYKEYTDFEAAYYLAMTYKNIIKKFQERNYYNGICIPAISCGIYGFPIEDACRIAVTVLSSEMYLNFIDRPVVLTAFDPQVQREFINLNVQEEIY